MLEGYGGDIPFNEVSAKSNIGLDELLDTILLVADLHDFRAIKDRDALAVVLEAHKDPKKGPLATILIKTGTLEVGQDVTVGNSHGRIRKIENYLGKSIEEALPSTPVTIFGLTSVPQSNDILHTEKKPIDRKRRQLLSTLKPKSKLSAGNLSSKELISNIDKALGKKFSIVLKSDVQGTLEAITQILATIKSKEISLSIIRSGVGPISESDVQAALTNNATVYGFSVHPTAVANRMAESAQIEIKTFAVLYELVESIKQQMSDLLEPEIKRTNLGRLKVLAIFKNMKKGMVVGGKVTSGKLEKSQPLEITRDKEFVGKGQLVQLQHEKQDVEKVKEGLQCGITFEGKDKIEVGDTLICYKEEKIKRKIN